MTLHVYMFQVQLSVEDIETILDTLIYDGKVERSVVAGGEEGQKLYRAVMSLVPTNGLMRTPCGVCPVSYGRELIFCDNIQQWMQY